MTRYTLALICAVLMLLSACSPKLESPEEKFLDSTLILRPGIADAGDMTVRQYVKRLASLPQPNGAPAKISGWTQTDQGYTLHAKVAGEFQVPFVWSKSEKLALLQYAEMEGERVPGMQFFMLTMSMKPVNGNTAAPAAQAKAAEPIAASTIPEAERPSEPPAPTFTAHAVSATPPSSVPHLCTGSETPIFACSTGKKRASVCSSRSGATEQLVYRLAPLEGAPEMEYPSGGATATAAFQYGAQTAPDGNPVGFVSFDKGNYRYVVYAGDSGDNPPRGILVEQSGKRIADLRCQSDVMSAISSEGLARYGMRVDQRPVQLP